MVARCVRDAKVVGSNPVASTKNRQVSTRNLSIFIQDKRLGMQSPQAYVITACCVCNLHFGLITYNSKSVNNTPITGGKGMSQNDASVGANRLDLSVEDWFVFNDNYGTSEEKAFVRYFKDYVDTLRSKYDKIYLLRNERQIHLYSFEGGERFEPDYILYLCKNRTDSIEQLIVFVEPKGTHLIADDKWKEDFLLELKGKSIPTITFADDNKYKI